jgi:hypothetical protein
MEERLGGVAKGEEEEETYRLKREREKEDMDGWNSAAIQNF